MNHVSSHLDYSVWCSVAVFDCNIARDRRNAHFCATNTYLRILASIFDFKNKTFVAFGAVFFSSLLNVNEISAEKMQNYIL